MAMSVEALRRTQERNFHHLWMESVWFGLAVVSTSQFLSIYAVRLGANAFELGLLDAVPAVVLMCSTGLGHWWHRRSSDTAEAIFWPSFGRRFTFFLLALTPVLPRSLQVPWLILSVTLPAIPQSINAVINPLLWREAIGDGRLTDLLSRRSIAQNVGTAVSGLAFGLWLKQARFPVNYQVMFALAFLIVLMSLWHFKHVKVPPLRFESVAESQSPMVWRSAGFRRVVLAATISYIGYYSMRAVIPLRLVNELGADEAYMSVYGVVKIVIAVAAAALAARMVRRTGNRTLLALAMGMMALEAVLLAAATDLNLALASAVFGGAAWTIVSIALYGFLADNTPNESRVAAAFQQTTYLATIVGPMLGSALASTSLNLVVVLLIGATTRLAAGALMEWLRWPQGEATRPA